MPGLTVAHIAAQIDTVLRDRPHAGVIAIAAATRDGEWPTEITRQGRRFALRWADSTLSVRVELATRHDDGDGLVILTPLPVSRFGPDVLARFDRGLVLAPDRWDMVLDAVQARDLDPRLRGQGWMADALLEHMPTTGYPPVPGGILDLDTAWSHLLRLLLDFDEAHTDVDALLRWTIKGEGIARFGSLDVTVRDAVARRASSVGGPAAAAVMACVSAGHGAHALPLGLLCRVLFDPRRAADPDLATARGRLELFTGGHVLDEGVGRVWADAAERAVERLMGSEPPGAITRWLERADQLARDLRVGPHVAASGVMLSGFVARLTDVGDALDAFLDDGGEGALASLERAVEAVRAHSQSRVNAVRFERLTMAVRLARWLTLPEPSPAADLGEAARIYGANGSFVDRARRLLNGGDDLALLASAYSRLSQRVRERRDAENARFAALLAECSSSPGTLSGIVPIERIVETVVAPLARQAPVLLLVLDGLSLPIYRELLPAILCRGWASAGPEGAKQELLALGMMPTITEVCRASLFAGRPIRGDDGSERSAFTGSPTLLGVGGRNRKPPLLFHKGALTDGASGMLAGMVRAAIGTPEHRVVGIVYNAIDEQLKGSNQLQSRWSLEELPLLSQILHEARNGGRIVVITADHGHVYEDGSILASDGDGDRWRRATGAARDGEILLTGERVLAPGGGNRIIAPYAERVRYGGKRNGYHGGAAPQEVIVPLGVLLPPELDSNGWEELPPNDPVWWDTLPATPAAASAPPARRKPDRTSAKTPTLFDRIERSPQEGQSDDWVNAVLDSGIYAGQRRIAGGRLPDDGEVRIALYALAERGGRWTYTSLAQRLQKPSIRLRGLLSQLRRLLNVDGYAVLSADDSTGTVIFDRDLLEIQFRVKEKGP